MARDIVSLLSMVEADARRRQTDTESRRRREAQHEVATDRLVEWCRRSVRVLGNVAPHLGRELEELLERHEATRPEETA